MRELDVEQYCELYNRITDPELPTKRVYPEEIAEEMSLSTKAIIESVPKPKRTNAVIQEAKTKHSVEVAKKLEADRKELMIFNSTCGFIDGYSRFKDCLKLIKQMTECLNTFVIVPKQYDPYIRYTLEKQDYRIFRLGSEMLLHK